MKSHINIKMNQRKKNPSLKKKKKVDLGAMSVDDFMKNGFDMSDESEEETNVGETRNGEIASSEEDHNGVLSSSDDVDDNEDEENEDTDEAESEDEHENEADIEGLADDDEDSDGNDGGDGDDDDDDDDDDVGGDDDDDDNDNENHVVGNEKNVKKVGKAEDEDGDWTSANFSHKKAMAKLKKNDPEFYKYLQENDKDLLNFDESDSDEEEKDDKEAGGIIHKPPESLEVASDESDYEGDGKRDKRTITLKMVRAWEDKLKKTTQKSCDTIEDVIHAFHAVVVRVSTDDDDDAKYVVTGSAVFNAVIQLCVLELQPALKKFLRIPSGKHVDPSKSKSQWSKVWKSISSYISDLIKLFSGVSSTDILAVMLKHLHQMVPYAACFPKLSQPILKKLVSLWATNEDTVRVIAFLCILRLTTHQQNKILDKVLKMMYLAFIRNCKFVSPNTLPAINFMRRSLVEILALDLNVTYQHAFLYIRQLAIHLRNAITLHKKETIQAVCNWQFINSIHVWADLLGATASKPQLHSLLYPLVQVTVGTIKLVPTPQYFPLRFHCTQILIELSKRSCTYVPVLPFLLEVLNTYDFNKGHTKVSMKPVVFTFVIRSSKSDMLENGFKDVVIDTIYKQMLEYLSNESHSISFPDLIIPAAMQMKEFLKKCRVRNYTQKIKQLHDKIMQNAQAVEKERQKVNFKLSDQKSIAAWESQLKLKGTPLSKFYESWSKIYAIQQAKKATKNDEIGDFNLPVLKKRIREEKPKPEGPVVLFPSDDSDSDINLPISDDEDNEPRTKRGKRGSGSGQRTKKHAKSVHTNNYEKKKEVNLDIEDKGDIIEDLKLEDLQ